MALLNYGQWFFRWIHSIKIAYARQKAKFGVSSFGEMPSSLQNPHGSASRVNATTFITPHGGWWWGGGFLLFERQAAGKWSRRLFIDFVGSGI